MKKLIFIFTILVCGLIFPLEAQPPNPGGNNNNNSPNCFPPPCVPIDGGLSWLLVAGMAYGGKKAYEFSKDNKKEED